jgi:hypothetical protein
MTPVQSSCIILLPAKIHFVILEGENLDGLGSHWPFHVQPRLTTTLIPKFRKDGHIHWIGEW